MVARLGSRKANELTAQTNAINQIGCQSRGCALSFRKERAKSAEQPPTWNEGKNDEVKFVLPLEFRLPLDIVDKKTTSSKHGGSCKNLNPSLYQERIGN